MFSPTGEGLGEGELDCEKDGLREIEALGEGLGEGEKEPETDGLSDKEAEGENDEDALSELPS